MKINTELIQSKVFHASKKKKMFSTNFPTKMKIETFFKIR